MSLAELHDLRVVYILVTYAFSLFPNFEQCESGGFVEKWEAIYPPLIQK